MSTQETRESLLEAGRKADAYEGADAHFDGFPSRFDGANDRELAMALHALSMESGQDEEYGDVDSRDYGSHGSDVSCSRKTRKGL